MQRALSLTKYLPEHGFEVHVLRAGNAAAPVTDPSLLSHVPGSVRVHHAFTPEIPYVLRHTVWGWLSRKRSPNEVPAAPEDETIRKSGLKGAMMQLARRILCPEPEVLWVPFAVRAARRIVRHFGITHLMVTVPPFSALLAGNALKREFPHIKYISDFRDEWLSFYLQDFEYQNNDYTRRRAVEIERETVERSNLVVAVTESSREEIRKRYPDLPDSKFRCVFNGYDPAAVPRFDPRARTRSDKIVIAHMGTVYKTASPRYYLDALDSMPEEIRGRIETRFIGRIADSERGVLEGRKSNVQISGFVPQPEALRQLAEADYLLLTMTNGISLPGKLFEYLATGKPILALSPAGGEVERMLRQAGGSWCVDPYDASAVAEMIRQAVACNDQGRTPGTAREIAERYARPHLTAEYARLLAAL